LRGESLKQREQREGYNKTFGLMHDRQHFEEDICEACGLDPCTCKKPDHENVIVFCPECHSHPCACEDNI